MNQSEAIRVLLVEDEVGDAHLVKMKLGQAQSGHFEVTWTQSLREAQRCLAASAFDVLLLDLSLPDSEGLATVHRARSMAVDMPIVVLSGRGDTDFALTVLEAGAVDYMVKGDFGYDGLARVIRYALLRTEMEGRNNLLVAALEAAANGIVITDKNAVVTWANPAFSRLTGYSFEEAVGNKPSKLTKSGLQDETFYRDMWKTLLAGRHWRGELINKRKNGNLYHEELNIASVKNGAGEITHFIGIKEDITERKQAVSRLQELEKRFRIVADAAPVLIWLTDTGKFCTWFNQVWLDFTGRSMEQELNNGWMDGVHPDDFQHRLSTYANHFDLCESFRMEYRLKRYDGEYRWIHDNGVPRFDVDGSFLGYIGSCIDITDRKLAEQKIAAQNLRYKTLLKSSTDGIHIIDFRGNIVDVNEAFCRQLGYSYAEALNLNVSQWDAQWTEENALPALRELFYLGEAKQFETKYRRKDGSIIDVEINAVQAVLEDQPILFASARTITERKQNEAVILLAKDRAEALAKSKSEFLANMSHEIRTPMNAIIGFSHLALNKELSPEIRNYLEKISNSSNGLLSVLNDILDFSKIEAGHLTIDRDSFDLDEMLDNISNLFADRAKEKHLNFDIDVAADVPRNLVGDTLRLQQVLINLLGNAVKFTERGKVALEITLLQIEQSQARLLFRVIDTGIGMSPADREKLFQPFSQVDGSITRRFGGTGLGLVISQNLLRLMGGEFSVESNVGKGSCFGFELVLSVSAMPNRRRPKRKPGMLGDFGKLLAGSRVLVAEDNIVNQQVVSEFLNLSGIDVEMAGNGKDALELLANGSFDAVLMDMHMPEMDGFEATKRIRSQPQFAKLPVIALTAGVTKEEQERCMAAGMNDFIAKPINPEKLISTLMQWIKPVEEVQTGTVPARQVATEASRLQDLPGFDLQNLLVMLGGNQELATQLLHTFMETMQDLPGEIDSLLAIGDLVSAKKSVHKIKGASGNVGAESLYAACEILEEKLKGEQSAAAAFNAFQEAFNQTMSAIAALQQPEKPVPHTVHNSEALIRSATELDYLLKENDFISESLLNTLKPHLAMDQLDLFAQLRKLVNDLQYSEARKILRQLAKLPDTQES